MSTTFDVSARSRRATEFELTTEQIHQRTLDVRTSWTAEERRRRAIAGRFAPLVLLEVLADGDELSRPSHARAEQAGERRRRCGW